VSPDDFHGLQAARRSRGHADRRRAGRPPLGYVVAERATCGTCGGPCDAVTGRHSRVDGSRARRYVCRAHRNHHADSSAHCPEPPYDADAADAVFVGSLDGWLGDVAGWRERLTDARRAERDRLEREIDRARHDAAEADRVMTKMRDRYNRALAADDDARADEIEAAMVDRRADRTRAQTRLAAAEQALTDVVAEQPIDPLLDVLSRLMSELAGRKAGAGDDVRRMNALVRDYFDEVALVRSEEGLSLMPVLSEAVAQRIMDDVGEWPVRDLPGVKLPEGSAPPLQPIVASVNPQPPS
jgi:hypothetical protein